MNSFAHYSFGAVYQWMVENIGGIKSAGPAFKHIIIAPHPDEELASADVACDCIHGKIESHWRKNGNAMQLTVTVPPNTTATVAVPASSIMSAIQCGRRTKIAGATFSGVDVNGAAQFDVGSGTYNFETK
jgi:alpha-L-rhamnosidase